MLLNKAGMILLKHIAYILHALLFMNGSYIKLKPGQGVNYHTIWSNGKSKNYNTDINSKLLTIYS